MKTVIFEEKYNTDISNFHSTKDVDTFLEEKLGRKLRVVDIDVIPVVDHCNIYVKINEALNKLMEKRRR
jgi:hypothetical protein